jgi:Phosphate starvation-inducible protein PhoH, predicted ATPase
MSSIHKTIIIDNSNIQNVFGQFDRNIRKVEKAFNVTYVYRGEELIITGDERYVDRAIRVLNDLYGIAKKGSTVTEQNVDYAIELVRGNSENEANELEDRDDIICYTMAGRPIRPKTFGQKEYTDAIDNNMIIFGTGPAGTGKTYLAMAKAINAFKKGQVERIILTRPAIEAGEKLGFLPGDLQSKIDPYLRPLYDALYEIMGAEQFQKNLEKELIEVAPLAYMRGRTLDNAFIVLDEAQNTTESQMKMFLTRIGFGSKAIITGDQTQKDLAANTSSGLDTALKVVKDIEGIAICRLTSKDVVRHPLVQKIVDAYEKYDNRRRDGKMHNNNPKNAR